MSAPPNRREGAPSAPRVSLGAELTAVLVARLRQSKLFRDYQQAFEATTGLPLVLREAGSFRTPLEGSKRANPFCALMTEANKTCAACLQLQQRAEDEATAGPKTLQCYAGLSETVVPVRIGDQVLGYIQTGQIFLRVPSQKVFRKFTRALDGGENAAAPHALESAYFQTRVVAREQYAAIIRLLGIFAEHLAAVSNQMLLMEAATESPVIARVRAYIAAHQRDQLSLIEVAGAVNMSPSYFCKVFKKSTGLTFTEYLARERIESAKQMLLNAHTRISEAAYAAGFQSLSQFNRVFRRVAGEAPSCYRDRLHLLVGKAARVPSLINAA